MSDEGQKDDPRRVRQAAQLRENLKRRRNLARSRAADDAADVVRSEGPEPPIDPLPDGARRS